MSKGITGDKMLSHLDRVAGERLPITADIFLTNYCNNCCPYCTYRRWSLEGGAYAMSLQDFQRYAVRLMRMGVKGFILTGGGEPTVAPDFLSIARWLESGGVRYGVNSNFNALHFIRPDYLKVSLDGWDEESYERARGVKAYQQTRRNIQAYAAWKKENSPITSLGIQMVATSVEAVRRFYEANRDLDVDYIVFRPKESTGGKDYGTPEALAEAKEIIQAVRLIQEGDERVTLNFKWELLGKTFERCSASWAQIAVNERGEVMYCCHKPYQIVGHILDPDILEKKEAAVTDMAGCDVPCRMTAPNIFMDQVNAARRNSCFI